MAYTVQTTPYNISGAFYDADGLAEQAEHDYDHVETYAHAFHPEGYVVSARPTTQFNVSRGSRNYGNPGYQHDPHMDDDYQIVDYVDHGPMPPHPTICIRDEHPIISREVPKKSKGLPSYVYISLFVLVCAAVGISIFMIVEINRGDI